MRKEITITILYQRMNLHKRKYEDTDSGKSTKDASCGQFVPIRGDYHDHASCSLFLPLISGHSLLSKLGLARWTSREIIERSD